MPRINAAITVCYYAADTNGGKTGDAANHTLRRVVDGSVATITASPAEVDATNLPGVYKVDLTAGENSGALMVVGGKSSTSGVVLSPAQWTNEVNAAQIGAAVPGSATIGTVTTLTGHTPQTGDSFARIGATGSGLTSLASATDMATLLGRLSAARAGYLDKLNVTGILAHSDAADSYKADVSALALEATVQAISGAISALENLSAVQAQAAVDAAILARLPNGTTEIAPAGVALPADYPMAVTYRTLDPVGKIDTITWASGVVWTYSYNGDGNLDSVSQS